MHILKRQHLAGVNRWFRNRTLAAHVEGLPKGTLPPHHLRTLVEALERLPLAEYQAGAGQRMQRALPPDSSWGRALIELTAELQFLSSEFRGACCERGTGQVALECQEFALAEACLDAAVQMGDRLQHGKPLELAPVYEELENCAYEVCLGGATGPLVVAARQYGIPAYRLDRRSLVQLGDGVHQQRIRTTTTSETSEIAVRVSTDKHLVGQLWTRIGIPVAAGRLAHDEDDALRAAQEIGWPVVVKPVDADFTQGVSLNLRSAEQVRAAYPKALSRSASGRVLVQRFLRGASHRLLVIDGRLVGAVRRDPISVVGDGRHSVRELVERGNQQGRWGAGRCVSIEDTEEAVLAEAGFTPETVPAPGVKILLSHHQAELYCNVTEQVHPDTRELACDATRVIGLDVAGLDVIAADIGRPLAEQGGGFLEINAEPALWLHGPHDCDRPQPIGEAIVSSLFPPPACGRVPLVVVLGDRSANAVVQLTAERLRRDGLQVAVSTPEQTCWNHRPLHPASASPVDRLFTMILHPRTEAAILRTSLAEVLQSGLGADQCDVLVCADGPSTTQGLDGEACTELLHRLTAASRRCVVNLDDPYWAASAAAALPTSMLVSANAAHPWLSQHLTTGRLAAFPHEGDILMRAGEVELARFPAGNDFPGAQALAAAAVFALGLEKRCLSGCGQRA